MAMTRADRWFESYLIDHGYQPGEHEPDLSGMKTEKRPDFIVTNGGGERAVCEIKAFGANALTRRLSYQRTAFASEAEVYGPIRNQVRAAARTLRPLASSGLPLVVVLTKTDPGVVIDLSVEHVLAALYGNHSYTIPIDRATGAAKGPGEHSLGRDGVLTNDRGYISAVALLRRREEGDDEREAAFAHMRAATPEWDKLSLRERAERYIAALDGRTFSDCAYYWLDVIDTASETATPVPSDWFAGSRDSRWSLVDGERFEQILP